MPTYIYIEAGFYLSIHTMQRRPSRRVSKSKALLMSWKLTSCVMNPSKLSSFTNKQDPRAINHVSK